KRRILFIHHYFDRVDSRCSPRGIKSSDQAAAYSDQNSRDDPACAEFKNDIQSFGNKVRRSKSDDKTESKTEQPNHKRLALDRTNDERFRGSERFENSDLLPTLSNGRIHREKDKNDADKRAKAHKNAKKRVQRRNSFARVDDQVARKVYLVTGQLFVDPGDDCCRINAIHYFNKNIGALIWRFEFRLQGS